MNETNALLTVTNVSKRFNLEAGFFARARRFVYAVNEISFTLRRNECYGLVGESGCGKTTTARLLVRMYSCDCGEILFHRRTGEMENVSFLRGEALHRYRENVKYIFQDPARSLNPRMTVYEAVACGARRSLSRKRVGEAHLRDEAAATLLEVGLSAEDLERRPAEFSGGQRQRISIARALLMRPHLLICDEVVSALDVSIQAQILNLLLDLRSQRAAAGEELSMIFIAHDLKAASYFCDRIGVMYRGEIVEEAPASSLWKNHLHPYTELLFASASLSSGRTRKENTQEEAPFPSALLTSRPSGAEGAFDAALSCGFAARCPYARTECFREKPLLLPARDGHLVRCFRSK